jgi:hypothetical protein
MVRISVPLLALAVMVHFAVTRAPHVEPWCRLLKDSALSDRGLLSSDNDRVVGVLRLRGGESPRTSSSPTKARQRHTRLESAAWMKENSAHRSTGSGADRSKRKKKKGLGSGPPTAEAIRCSPLLRGSTPSSWPLPPRLVASGNRCARRSLSERPVLPPARGGRSHTFMHSD